MSDKSNTTDGATAAPKPTEAQMAEVVKDSLRAMLLARGVEAEIHLVNLDDPKFAEIIAKKVVSGEIGKDALQATDAAAGPEIPFFSVCPHGTASFREPHTVEDIAKVINKLDDMQIGNNALSEVSSLIGKLHALESVRYHTSTDPEESAEERMDLLASLPTHTLLLITQTGQRDFSADKNLLDQVVLHAVHLESERMATEMLQENLRQTLLDSGVSDSEIVHH